MASSVAEESHLPVMRPVRSKEFLYPRADAREQHSGDIQYGCQGDTSWSSTWGLDTQSEFWECQGNTDKKSTPVSIPRGMDFALPQRRTML